MPAPGVVLAIAVVLIVAAMVYYLLSTIVALRQITKGLDEAIAGVGEMIEKTAPVEPVVNDINANLDAAVDALEGLLVKKAGLRRRGRPDRRPVPGRRRRGPAQLPGVRRRSRRRGSPRSTRRGVLTLARLGREAPIAAASPEGPVLRHPDRGRGDDADAVPERAPAAPRATWTARRSSAPTRRSSTSRRDAGTAGRRALRDRADREAPRQHLGRDAEPTTEGRTS